MSDESKRAPKRRRRWIVAAAVGMPLLALAVLGHTKAGRAMLGADKCPWGQDAPSAERLEEFRVKNATALKSTTRAAARPAFGFVLDQTTRAEVMAWGTSTGSTCHEELKGAALRCEASEQPTAAEAVPVKDAFFRFDPKGVLVGVDLMRDGTNGEKAAAVLTTITAQIAREAGPPSTVQGTASPAHLAGYLNRAGTEFRFANYAADVSATNLGEQGVVVREQYRSIPN